ANGGAADEVERLPATKRSPRFGPLAPRRIPKTHLQEAFRLSGGRASPKRDALDDTQIVEKPKLQSSRDEGWQLQQAGLRDDGCEQCVVDRLAGDSGCLGKHLRRCSDV